MEIMMRTGFFLEAYIGFLRTGWSLANQAGAPIGVA